MPIKIIFIIPSLRSGGAERVMSFLAQHINKDLFYPILLIVGHNKDVAYDIKKDKVSRALPKITRFLHNSKPDIIISAISHVNMAMALISPLFPNTKFVGRETIVASKSTKQKSGNIILKFLSKLKPRLLDCIVCQSNDMKRDLIDNYNYPEKKLHTINNPVTKRFRLKETRDNSTKFQLITVGRMTKQKGYPRILKALSNLKIPFEYTIIGNGPLYSELIDDIRKYRLDEKIKHVPYTNEVETFLSKSDLFLSGSYVEGFPNAILESCAVGTPVLAYNVEGGLNEIIQPGVNGYLASSDKEFMEKLELSINKNWNANEIRKSVVDRYSEDIIIKNYENLFLKLVGKNPQP